MNNKIVLIIILALTITSCSISGQKKPENDENVDFLMEIISSDLELETKTDFESLESIQSFKGLNDVNGSLESMLSNTEFLFLRISETHCGLCIETEISQLVRLLKKQNDFQIGVLATFNSARNIRILMKSIKKEKINVFLVPQGDINLTVEQANTPYYFYLKQDLTVDHTFIPKRNFPQLTDSYYAGLSYKEN